MKKSQQFSIGASIAERLGLLCISQKRRMKKDVIGKPVTSIFAWITLRLTLGSLSHKRIENLLTDTKTLGRNLQKLIGVNEFETLLKAHLNRGNET